MDTTSPLPERSWLGSRLHRLDFALRASIWRLRRGGQNALARWWHGEWPQLPARRRVDEPHERPLFVLSSSTSALWTQRSADEWPLTAGKVHNLRVAAQALDGLVVQPHQVFSFWGALGRPSRRRGYVAGRELREGCLIASIGGGLCQLSNALYAAALDAGARIVERHAHSQQVPGSQAEHGRDATVFWNYLDLRFQLNEPFEIEARLDAERLIVRLRGVAPRCAAGGVPKGEAAPGLAGAAGRVRDCGACDQPRCAHHRPAAPGQGRCVALLPRGWPELEAWVRAQPQVELQHVADQRGWRVQLRRLAARLVSPHPARRQQALLRTDDARARAWAATLPAAATELIVPVDHLAALWREGVLQGRRYTVLMTRSPLQLLHQQLDAAARAWPAPSLREYRASAPRVAAEWDALRAAQQLVTPHAALAAQLRAQLRPRVVALDWHRPAPGAAARRGRRVLFPASALARKGAFELRCACRELGLPLSVLGRARERDDFWLGLDLRSAHTTDPWRDVSAVALPAWVEQAPRLLLAALARGLPVIATPACGLAAGTPGLTLVPAGDVRALARALAQVVGPAAILPAQR